MGVVQQEPEPGGPGTSKRDGNWTNRLGNPLMHDMHRSMRGWDYRSPSRQRLARKRRGRYQMEERSRSTKVDHFSSQLDWIDHTMVHQLHTV